MSLSESVRLVIAEQPFSVSIPIGAECGESLISVDLDGQSLTVAVLPCLAGQPLDRRNLGQIRSAGFSLAKLHDRLAKFDPSGQLAQLPFWGDLVQIHPQIRDPLAVPTMLRLGLEEQTRFGQLLNEVIEAAPYLYKTLPIQTIHADYIAPNILVECDRVVGILDFEFATRDLRLLRRVKRNVMPQGDRLGHNTSNIGNDRGLGNGGSCSIDPL